GKLHHFPKSRNREQSSASKFFYPLTTREPVGAYPLRSCHRARRGRGRRRRGAAPCDCKQDAERPQLLAMVAPAREVLVEQRLDGVALEPIGDLVGARQQQVAAAFAK